MELFCFVCYCYTIKWTHFIIYAFIFYILFVPFGDTFAGHVINCELHQQCFFTGLLWCITKQFVCLEVLLQNMINAP